MAVGREEGRDRRAAFALKGRVEVRQPAFDELFLGGCDRLLAAELSYRVHFVVLGR